jgi:DNA-binding NarL/FixJ family response regulator
MNKSILIVDDNAILRRAVRQVFLSQEDFAVCWEAENGQEAIEKAQDLRPDLIVMDLAMPVMGGIDAARVLSRLMPTVPLLVLSGYSEVFSETDLRSAGFSGRVSKSEHISVLLGKARALLCQDGSGSRN